MATSPLFFFLACFILALTFSVSASTALSSSPDLETTNRKIFAISRVFKTVRRYKKFATFTRNQDSEKTKVIRAILTKCVENLKNMQKPDNEKNVTVLLSTLITVLEWLACNLN